MTSEKPIQASSECPICGRDSPHDHTPAEIARYERVEPVAKALCAAFGHDWDRLTIDEWPWQPGRTYLCRDFFRWQARFALGVIRAKDWRDQPQRAGMPTHGGAWPLSEFAALRQCGAE